MANTVLPTNMPPVPYKSPIADEKKIATRDWVKFFEDAVKLLNSLQTQVTTASSNITALQGNINDLGQGRQL